MATAIAARQNGDDWQAYYFWREVLFMLAGKEIAEIARVGFEVGEFKAFDDVAIEHTKGRPDGRGGLVQADYYQIKFSTALAKYISADALTDPAFINASSVSLLERLRDAVANSKKANRSVRFILLSPWPVAPDDILGPLVDMSTGAIRIEELKKGATAKSKNGGLREKWCKHLNVTEPELYTMLERFCIRVRPSTLEEARRDLNLGLSAAGLTNIPDATLTDAYSSLIWKLSGLGRRWFTTSEILECCKQEQLMCPNPVTKTAGSPRVLGIRSFMRWAENLEDETDALICLTEYFTQRHIRDRSLWASSVLPGLKNFLTSELKAGRPIELDLQTHGTIAFAAGYLTEPKAGIKVGIRQRSLEGLKVWGIEPDGLAVTEGLLEFNETVLGDASGVACAISITHSISQAVEAYLNSQGNFGHLLGLSVPQPSALAVKSGNHAFQIAQALVEEIRNKRPANHQGPLHLFVAMPNGLAFMFGQLARALGDIQLYEFDFGGTGGYSKSVLLQPSYSIGS